jgi:hypothetical protein
MLACAFYVNITSIAFLFLYFHIYQGKFFFLSTLCVSAQFFCCADFFKTAVFSLDILSSLYVCVIVNV